MAIVDDLNRVMDWLQEHVCDKVKLKAPDDEDRTEDYDYKLESPRAFIQYIPPTDRLPTEIRTNFPSLCVRLVEGEHKQGGTNVMQIMLHFGAWNPGQHARDVYTPRGAGFDQETVGEFKRTVNGWQDVISFVDRALREIETAENIAGMRVVTEDGIKYGFVDESLEGNYPYWFAWVTFSVQAGNVRAKSIEQFL